MEPHPLAAARKRDALSHALGEAVLAALEDPEVVEILANPDGRLVLDRLGEGRRDSGLGLAAEARERVIRLVADHVGETVNRASPRLSGVLPGGERFQGVLPPVAPQPAFSIRKRPGRIWTLDDYVGQGVLSWDQAGVLRSAVAERRNLLICGGAGSGKTTLANAILAEPAFAGDRVILIEDVPELQCAAWDLLPLLTRRAPQAIGVVDLVRDALRLRPDRIVVGEMRDGAAALETLKAWNTGHPGGLATLHANSAEEAIARLEDLLMEVLPRPAPRLIAQGVDLIVHIRRTRDGRTVAPILAMRSGPGRAGDTARRGTDHRLEDLGSLPERDDSGPTSLRECQILPIGMISEMDSPVEFGSAVRRARKALGLTQRDLALAVGVGERFVVELERGKATVQLGKALAVARAVGLRLIDARG